MEGCEIADTAILVNIGAPLVSASITAESCSGLCDGTLNATASGGTGSISYLWDNGIGSGANHVGVCPGSYLVIATDSSGCQSEETVVVGNGTNYPNANFMNIPASTTTAVGSGITFINSSSGGATSYLWDFGDGVTSSMTNPGSHSWGSPGSYTVTLYATNGPCTDSLQVVFTIVPNDLNEGLSNLSVVLFPNPTEDNIQLQLIGKNNLELALDVFSIDGKKIFSDAIGRAENQIIVDLSSYSSGIYVFVLYHENEKIVRRITKY